MFRFMLLLVVPALLIAGCASKPALPDEPLAQAVAPSFQAPAAEPAAVVPTGVTITTADGSALETVFFSYDSAVLQPAAREVLQRNAAWLQSHPQTVVTIEGHCDERGSGEYNLALGEQRASAVRNYLVNLGVETARLNTLSYGEELPLDRGHTETAWVKNRRAAFR